MSFSANDMRGSHTIRIFGTNKDDEVLHDIWLDIERVDVLRISTKVDGIWQGQFIRLHWNDDPNGEGLGTASPGEGNPARETGTLQICSPDEEDQENPEEWVPVKTIIQMGWKKTTTLDNRMDVLSGNRTSANNQVRIIEARRCIHRDTIIDDKVDKATTDDPTLKAYVVPSDQYDFKTENYDDPDDKTKDENTYIEVQYVSRTVNRSSTRADSNGTDQTEHFYIKNKHYLNFTKKAEGPANETHGFDPPWALDQYQAIVNVQWGGQAVEFFDEDE